MTQFASALIEAMTARDINMRQLAARTGINVQTISNLRRGLNTPRPHTASALADALNWDSLAQMVMRDRSRTCRICRRTFITQHTDPNRMKWCSRKCQQVSWRRDAPKGDGRKRREYEKKTTMLLRDHQAAIEAFCRSCSPVDFICRDSGCELRGLSPLPFVTLTRRVA